MAAISGVDLVHVHHWRGLSDDLVRHAAARSTVVLSLHDAFTVCPTGERVRPGGGACPERGRFDPCVGCESGAGEADEAALRGRARSLAAEVAAARRVVFPSLAHLVRLREHLDLRPERVRILPHGLLEAAVAAPRRPRPWSGEGPLSVLLHGHRSAERGALDLVDSLAALPPGSVRLVACGSTVSEELDRELVRRAEGRFALELGPASGPGELARLAADCHVAALPSRLPESYSLELDEVMAAGLPPWVTFDGVARERFDRSSFDVLPPSAVRAWTQAFRALLKDPQRSAFAFECLPRSIAPFSVESLEHLYEDAVAEHHGAARRRAA